MEKKIRTEEQPIMAEHLAKYRSLMPALALINHSIDIAGGQAEGQVSEQAATQAAAGTEVLESHARRVYGQVEDISQRAARELAGKILQGRLQDSFTIYDVYKNHWHLLDKDNAKKATEELCEANWLKKQNVEILNRQTKEVFLINPKIFCKAKM
ncbi:MAG TPA: hypothetical protein DCK87_02635 [Desulfotomaculum sp.]|nr:hypothetical protein [Desulfotomaculum sp.]